MSSYTDVLKGLMTNRYPVTLLNPAHGGLEMDDGDDYYDFWKTVPTAASRWRTRWPRTSVRIDGRRPYS
ncbi:unnamed protein product [Caenorhabditis sp. 36 PRJEB53466]|nr:unnamed protein product [Caenorhabditis sp. 36 PRJEB53466]